MIPNGLSASHNPLDGYRFSDKIMLEQKSKIDV
jgi:hypothetical protein